MNKLKLVSFLEYYFQQASYKADHFAIVKILDSIDTDFKNVDDFYHILTEIGEQVGFAFSFHHQLPSDFDATLQSLQSPLIVFSESDSTFEPSIVHHGKQKELQLLSFHSAEKMSFKPNQSLGSKQKVVLANSFNNLSLLKDVQDDEILFITGFPIPSIVSASGHHQHMKPLDRVLQLLKTEKKDISHIYFFAIMMGLVNLALPLGIQAMIGLISGGLFLNSVIVLMVLIVFATVVSGWIQVLQLGVVEVLQQRVFAKAAVEFTYRIPRIRIDSIQNSYAPELMNRFFDVLTIQKSLPKILIDLSTAGIQILFGLILLALYHPLFIFFGVLIVAIVAIIFYVTGKPAMESNIESSKYKYRVAYWIEELARSLHTFKLAGNTALPMSKMDMLLNGYLTYRQKHFKILVKQFKAMIAFKTFITAGLLVLGSVLVVNRQISLGQFVAAEIIILLVIASVEKLISILETVYDLLTAVDKVGHITDIPLERLGGTDLKKVNHSFGIELKNISYTYPHAHGSQALKNINLSITEGEKICVCGFNGSGKTTLLKMLSGLYPEYKGHFSINGLAFSSLKLESYRMMVSDNFSDQDLFEGTLLENITLGKKQASPSEVITLASRLGLSDFIASLPDGIETHLEAGAPLFSKSVKEKILIARSLMESPKLMLIDEFFYNSEQKEKERILNEIFAQPSAMVIISNDENIMKRCSKVILMKEGSIAHQGDAHSIKSYLQ